MIEPYQWLLAHAEEYGFPIENIGPASVDLSLANNIVSKYFLGEKTYTMEGRPFFEERIVLASNGTIIMMPHVFYLCSSQEYIYVPPTHCAMVQMRSSPARRGLGHKVAGFVDPGFHGQITFELTADIPIELAYGERIAQIIYMRLTELTERPYIGKYNGQTGPTEAYTPCR